MGRACAQRAHDSPRARLAGEGTPPRLEETQKRAYSDSELSSDDGYSQPVALRPESARLMLTWLGGARARRAEAGSDRALGDSTMSSGDDSDDLGGGASFDAPVVVSEKAQSLAKWWLENTRRRNEEERARRRRARPRRRRGVG